MIEPQKNKPSIEVSSDMLKDELTAIKDRLSAIETIESISNAVVVKKYVEEYLVTDKQRAYLKDKFGYQTLQALDYHLRPLREADLLRPKTEDGTMVFEWSNLFRRLPKATIKAILKKK
jgi:hypothetical protein